jgi:hypothetical protein
LHIFVTWMSLKKVEVLILEYQVYLLHNIFFLCNFIFKLINISANLIC